jgi:hypothetical protein
MGTELIVELSKIDRREKKREVVSLLDERTN